MAERGLHINLFLANRSWHGLVAADSSTVNAKVFSAPKTRLADLLREPEIRHPSIYFLTGPDSEAAFGLEGYVGESDELDRRLRSHLREKSFWNRAYVATTRDGAFTKAHLKYLESRLIQQAKKSPLLSRLVNSTEPEYAHLPKHEQASADDYLGFLQLVFPAIGCPLYSFPDFALSQTPALRLPEGALLAPGDSFELTKGNARALAYFKDEQLWVCAGSTARLEEHSSLREGYQKTRRDLIDKGFLARDERKGLLVFMRDTPFNSPSDAAAVVGTVSLNGKKEWKLAGTRITLGEWLAEHKNTGT